jgi:2',3'-cyclic-nucleotide 2'-phosphodiesterase (5'-nucleotidase family)
VEIHVPGYSRRRFLRALGQGTLLAALPAGLLRAEDNLAVVSILHTTDLHGHILPTTDYQGRADLGGLARCATQIRRWRAENSNSLLIDLGDVYQGTEASLAAGTGFMLRLFDALRYDAWVVGNHEFDWGADAFAQAVGASASPVLSANARHRLAGLHPWLVREIDGFRIAIIGLTTPGLPFWLPPEYLAGFEVLDPIESLHAVLPAVAAQRPDAIVLAGHMGLTRRDDFANRIGQLTQQFPQLAVCLGAHTHQDHPGETINGVLYTQADHFGIHVGRVDLVFDRATRRLVRRAATTVLMDSAVPLDPLVVALTQKDIAAGDRLLAGRVGALGRPFGTVGSFGSPSDVERLIASAMRAALRTRGVEVDAIAHGLFDATAALAAGPVTLADLWRVLPYENAMVTLELTRADLLALAQDLGAHREYRNLMGLRVIGTASPGSFAVTDLRAANGSPLPPKDRYRVALNAYDAQSGGQRFPVVGQLAALPANRRVLYPVTTRAALADFLAARPTTGLGDLLV